MTHFLVIPSGTTATIPASASSIQAIHAIGGGQAGGQGSTSGPGIGGKGADYAKLINPTSVRGGDVLSCQIGLGGTTDGAAGTDTWLKDRNGNVILRAKGGASLNSSLGDFINHGGSGVAPVASNDASYGNSLTPGYGGTGGGGSGGPNNPGGDGGDTNYAVGQVGGTGGGCGDSAFAAPGQAWLTAGHTSNQIGCGGGRTAGGIGGARGPNNSFGNALNGGQGGGGGGCDGVSFTTPNIMMGGTSNGPETLWTDSISLVDAGPGGGGGGGAAGWYDTLNGPYNPGNGGPGGLYGGGGGGSGGIPNPGDPHLGQAQDWATFSATLAHGGVGGDGVLVVEYTQGPSPFVPVPGDDDTVIVTRTLPIPKVRQLLPFPEVPYVEHLPKQAVSDYPIKFRVFDQTGLRISVDGIELAQSGFTFTGRVSAFPGWDDQDAIIADPDFLIKNNPYPCFRGGTATLSVAAQDVNVRIWSDPAPSRTDDYNPGDLKMAPFNRSFERLWVTDRAQHLKLYRVPLTRFAGQHFVTDTDSGEILAF